ncbi:unnamed protein product [Knipowitschia caucasica]|uniref:tRNA (guanine-N(7)-)-methyltransferase non-catalytic subunit WDR4 n=2 Tax=Knipowitschia caucasica TaxID=637954 RepID=A0AAV2JW22_KNICA
MAAVQFCGEWFICSCDKRLLAVHSTQDRAPFEFDCSAAEKRPKKAETDGDQAQSGEHDPGSDHILAMATSASGSLLALSDDSKRLVLLRREPAWTVVSVRWLARRCTALVFSRAEDFLLVADKSGDVYSASVKEPSREPELQLGHLSMVLDVAVSVDDRFIVTCDRDEKIRVSWSKSPYNIQSFCLGHQQFVSALLAPSRSPRSLLSGSGDGTVCVWDIHTGQQQQCVELRGQLQPKDQDQAPDQAPNDAPERLTVSRLRSSPDGCHMAVLCERVNQIQLLSLEQTEQGTVLSPHSLLSLSHCPLDLTFDPCGRLWVLLDRTERPLEVYSLTQGSYQQVDAQSPDVSRVTSALSALWESVDVSRRHSSRLEHLYVETFDNVSEYMRKKQQRLDQQNSKRNYKQEKRRSQDQSQSQSKKSKTDATAPANGS